MDRQKHFIQRNLFEITLSDRSKFHNIADRLGLCFRQDLKETMEDMFDELVPTSEIIRVRKIEIDLGYIPEAQLETALRERFPHLLRDQLLEILSAVRIRGDQAAPTMVTASPPVQLGGLVTDTLDRPTGKLRALLTYFLHGRFPMEFYLGEDEDLDTLANEVLEESPTALAEALRVARSASNVPWRIGHQLADATYWKVITVLAPSAVSDFKRLLTSLPVLLGQLGLPEATGRRWTAPEAELKVMLLKYLLQERPVAHARKAVLRYFLEALSPVKSWPELQIALGELLDHSSGYEHELLTGMQQVIEEWRGGTFPEKAAFVEAKAPARVTDEPTAIAETTREDRELLDADDEESDLTIPDHPDLVPEEDDAKSDDVQIEPPSGFQESPTDQDTPDSDIPADVKGIPALPDQRSPQPDRITGEYEGIADDVITRLQVDQQRRALEQIAHPYEYMRDTLFTFLLGSARQPWWTTDVIDAVVPVTLPVLLRKYPQQFARDLRSFIQTVSPPLKQQALDLLVTQADDASLSTMLGLLQPALVGYHQLLIAFLGTLEKTAEDMGVGSIERPYSVFFRPFAAYREIATTSQDATRYIIIGMAAASGISAKQLVSAMYRHVDKLVTDGERRFSPIKHTLQVLGQMKLPETGQEVYTAKTSPDEAFPPMTSARQLYTLTEPETLGDSLHLWQHFVRFGSLPAGSSMSAREFSRMLSGLLDEKPQAVTSMLREHGRSLIRHPSLGNIEEEVFLKLLEHLVAEKASYERLVKWKSLVTAIRPETIGVKPPSVRQFILLMSLRSQPPGRISIFVQELVTFLSKVLSRPALDITRELLQRATGMVQTEQSKYEELRLELEAQLKIQSGKKQKPRAETEILRIPWRTEELEEIYVHNAGLVILWPFFGHYFKQLDMLDSEGNFTDENNALRAVHLLEYLATKRILTPEYALTLNKLLCGIGLEVPTDKGIEMTERETGISESLLGAVIKQWEALKSTSPDGLRGGFLVREGALTLREDGNWKLRVEQKPYDLLLDKLPWGINVIKLKWCPYLIHVEWR